MTAENVLKWTRVPPKYHRLTADYDSCTPKSVQQYNTLKHSAKYIFSKLSISNDSSPRKVTDDEVADLGRCCGIDASSRREIIVGPHGEMYLVHEGFIQVFDWFPVSKRNNIDERWLYLIHQFEFPQIFKVRIAFPLHYDRLTDTLRLLFIVETSKGLELCYQDCSENVDLPIDFQLDAAAQYVGIVVDSKECFVLYNKTSSVLSIFNYESLKLMGEFKVQVVNGNPVFDLKGSHLTYHIHCDDNEAFDKEKFVPVNLASKGSLLNKLIRTFSNTAIDSMLMFSEVSQHKINNLIEKRKELEKQDSNVQFTKELKNNYRDIFVEMYNTISKSSSFIRSVDLQTGKEIFKLNIPTGCSKISISPYDLQLLTVSKRGDELYLWDYTTCGDTIILQDKYTRGKTSAIIDAIQWGSGSDSIFCLSRSSGSLHCFVNESLSNYEDFTVRKNMKLSNKKRFLNPNNKSWCISNMKFKHIAVVNLTFIKPFVIAIDKHENLLLIDYDKGNVVACIDFTKYTCPSMVSNNKRIEATGSIRSDLMNKEIEVETCRPFLPSYNNKKYKFVEVELVRGTDSNDTPNLTASMFSDIDSHLNTVKVYQIGGATIPRVSTADIPTNVVNIEVDASISGDTYLLPGSSAMEDGS